MVAAPIARARSSPALSPEIRITAASFLAYCVMSGMLSPIGIVLPALAEFTGLGVTAAADLFSWLTVGILLGSALALVVFDVLALRAAMLLVYAVIAGALLALRFSSDLWVLRLALGVVGCGCGIGLAAAASAIALLYRDDRRASMLVITDGAFSISGAATSALAVALVAAGLHWSAVYLSVAGCALLIVLIAGATPYPAAPAAAPAGTGRARWPAPVWLCIGALFLYTLGQYSLLWWLPTHLESTLGMPRDSAGSVVSRFWSGMLVGQLFVAWWVLRIGARRLVLLSVSATCLMSLPLWIVAQPELLPGLALLWGIANLGLLKVVIAFASLAVAVPSPRLIAALLFGATSGTAVSPAVTSALVEAFGTLRVLQFGSLCYLTLAVLVLLAHRLSAAAAAAGEARRETDPAREIAADE
jgi:TsgA-like MFS transporter